MEMIFLALILFGAMGVGISMLPIVVRDTMPIIEEIFAEDDEEE